MRFSTKKETRVFGWSGCDFVMANITHRKPKNKSSAMHLYTFITEYKGGTYIIQVKARQVEEAAQKWTEEMLSEHIPGLDGDAFKSAFQERMNEFKPAKIDDTKNVWYIHFFSGRNRMEVHVVNTLPADEEDNVLLSSASSKSVTVGSGVLS